MKISSDSVKHNATALKNIILYYLIAFYNMLDAMMVASVAS